MLVAQHLDLDVARLSDEFFDEDPVVAKALAASFLETETLRALSSFQAMRIPLPPPPALALIITG